MLWNTEIDRYMNKTPKYRIVTLFWYLWIGGGLWGEKDWRKAAKIWRYQKYNLCVKYKDRFHHYWIQLRHYFITIFRSGALRLEPQQGESKNYILRVNLTRTEAKPVKSSFYQIRIFNTISWEIEKAPIVYWEIV